MAEQIDMEGRDFDWETLIDRNIDACNARDLDAFFEIAHPGIAYFDAFWRETCVGRDFRQYMQDWFAIDRFEYSRIGRVIRTSEGAAFRYSAIDMHAEVLDEAMYTGIEVFTVREGKIVTISDYYCDPSTEAMREVIRLSASRHGQPRYATAGYSQVRMSVLQRRVVSLIETQDLHLDADLTIHELARMIECTPGQLVALATGRISPEKVTDPTDLLAQPAGAIIAKIKRRASAA